jgi:hypothetical protein
MLRPVTWPAQFASAVLDSKASTARFPGNPGCLGYEAEKVCITAQFRNAVGEMTSVDRSKKMGTSARIGTAHASSMCVLLWERERTTLNGSLAMGEVAQ